MALLLNPLFGTFIFKSVDHKEILLSLANTMSTLLCWNKKLKQLRRSQFNLPCTSFSHALAENTHFGISINRLQRLLFYFWRALWFSFFPFTFLRTITTNSCIYLIFFFLPKKYSESPPAGIRTSKTPPAAQSIKN